MRFSALILSCALLFAHLPLAAETKQLTNTLYVTLEPAFVANYGGPGRLKYVKTNITLMVDGEEHKLLTEQQKPLIRNVITLILSRQNEKNITTSAGQERVRMQLLQGINDALAKEIGQGIIADVLFTNFIYQN